VRIPKTPFETPTYTLSEGELNYAVPRPVSGYVVGNRLDNSLNGHRNSDYLDGRQGDDYINGAQLGDTVIGGVGDDTLSGGSHNDLLFGGQGRDVFEDAHGNDVFTGGPGNDVFAFNTIASHLPGVGIPPGGVSADTVTDFQPRKDSVVLFNYRGEALAFTQTGDDVLLTADGNPVATFLDADADQVSAATTAVYGSTYFIA
jgi:Ca2+-binding RTX toxin-like protein